MPQKRLTTNGNVFRRTDGRWQSVIWYFDEQGIKRRKFILRFEHQQDVWATPPNSFRVIAVEFIVFSIPGILGIFKISSEKYNRDC